MYYVLSTKPQRVYPKTLPWNWKEIPKDQYLYIMNIAFQDFAAAAQRQTCSSVLTSSSVSVKTPSQSRKACILCAYKNRGGELAAGNWKRQNWPSWTGKVPLCCLKQNWAVWCFCHQKIPNFSLFLWRPNMNIVTCSVVCIPLNKWFLPASNKGDTFQRLIAKYMLQPALSRNVCHRSALASAGIASKNADFNNHYLQWEQYLFDPLLI